MKYFLTQFGFPLCCLEAVLLSRVSNEQDWKMDSVYNHKLNFVKKNGICLRFNLFHFIVLHFIFLCFSSSSFYFLCSSLFIFVHLSSSSFLRLHFSLDCLMRVYNDHERKTCGQKYYVNFHHMMTYTNSYFFLRMN